MPPDPASTEVVSELAIEQRLRRACHNGRKKQATGGERAVEMYKDLDKHENGRNADLLLTSNPCPVRVKYKLKYVHAHAMPQVAHGASEAAFKREITKYVEEERTALSEIKVGWYTAMATVLKMSAPDPEPIHAPYLK